MEIILLESIKKLGNVGSVVRVRNGFARNFLIPNKKAVPATEDNIAFFEKKRKEMEATHNQRVKEAEKIVAAFPEQLVLIRQAADDGHLFGSVTGRDIISQLQDKHNITVSKTNVNIPYVLKQLGLHKVWIDVYGDIGHEIVINIARSAEEANVVWQKHLKEQAAAAKKEEASEPAEATVEESEAEAKPAKKAKKTKADDESAA